MSKSTKTTAAAKSVKKTVKAETAPKAVKAKTAPKAVKAAKPASIGERALATVYKVKKAYPNGVRAEFTSAIPKAGAPLSEIAKKAKIPATKARGYAYWLATNGFLTRVAA